VESEKIKKDRRFDEFTENCRNDGEFLAKLQNLTKSFDREEKILQTAIDSKAKFSDVEKY
jgi:hypothetical protein